MSEEFNYQRIDVPQGAQLDGVRPDLPEPLREALSRAKGALVRTIFTLQTGERRISALGYHRRGTAQEKLTSVSGDPALFGPFADRIAADAAERGLISLKLELSPDARPWLDAALASGFVPLAAPVSARPFPEDATAVPLGLIRRLGGWSAPELAYYRQTTELTCGPVAALTAAHALGLAPQLTRDEEIQLWREATSFPGCGPYGLAVGLAQRGIRPRVVVNTTAAMQMENPSPAWLSDMREFINTDFRLRSEAAGVEVELRDFDAAEILDLVGEGNLVVLLIDELRMHAEACSHWVTVHGRQGSIALIDDPWTDHDLGESWVDAHELAVTAETLEEMSSWGDPAYRSMLVFPARR